MSQTNAAPIFLPELPERQRRRAPSPARRAAIRRRNAVRRLALGLILATAGGVVLTRATGWALRPVMASYHAGQEIEQLQSRLAVQQARKRRLLNDIAFFKTSTGVEEEARRQGWVRSGETAIQLVRPEQEALTPAEGTPPPQPTSASLLERVRHFLATCFAGFGGHPAAK